MAQAQLHCKLASGLFSVGLLVGGRLGAGVPCVSPRVPSIFVLCFLLAAIHLFPEAGRLAGGESPCQLLCLPIFSLDFSGGPGIHTRLINNVISKSFHVLLLPSFLPSLDYDLAAPGLQPPCLPISLLPGPQAFPPCFTPPLTISSLQEHSVALL